MFAIVGIVIFFFSGVTVAEELHRNLSINQLIVTNCSEPSLKCLEKNMYRYLEDTLDDPGDLEVKGFVKFSKNQNVSSESQERSLRDKGSRFFMSHDVELQLPETLFEGSTLKISPRAFEGDGALIKVELIPKVSQEVEEGRLFKKKIKKFGDKLVWALLAILLVIKLIAVKVLFFLPTIVGAVAAKKLIIKLVLFVFPALSHFFKLCAYAPHGTKFHHHKHQISHIHHVPGGHPHHHSPSHGHGDGIEIIAPHHEGPPHLNSPSLHHYSDHEPPQHPSYSPDEQQLDYYSGGPHLSHEFINHRQDPAQEDNDIEASPWGQGQQYRKPTTLKRPPIEIENMLLKAEKEALIKARLQQEKLKIQEENNRLQEQLRQAMKIQDNLRLRTTSVKTQIRQPSVPSPFLQTPAPPPQIKSTYLAQAKSYQQEQLLIRQQQEQMLIKQQQEQVLLKQQQEQLIQQQKVIKQQQEMALLKQKQEQQLLLKQQEEEKKKRQNVEEALYQAATVTWDSFYSPILEKIDPILVGLGFNEEPCRERLICSMYKNPEKFSPHSNLLSAELSRDSNELQRPTSSNAAVVRFYRYVQAARDGQDKRECIRLYPACNINTEL